MAMGRTVSASLLLLTAILLPGCGPDTQSKWVVIETKEPAFVVFTPTPPNMSETLLRRIVAESSRPEAVRTVERADFPAAIAPEAQKVIIRNDFPGTALTSALTCLMNKAPGPWGITWNGGIALTRNDYDHARRTYETKAPLSGPSPVDPKSHLGPLGCL